MYQTHPKVLRDFMEAGDARYRAPNGRLFHPKVYLFETKTGVCVVVGSHNLTGGAFGGSNIEVSVMYNGNGDDPVIADLTKFIKTAWRESDDINEDFLLSYEPQYKQRQRQLEQLSRFYRIARPKKKPPKLQPLSLTWGGYVAAVRDDENHDLEGRLSILERASRLFMEKDTLSEMKRDERRAIAGTFGKNEATFEDLPWAWFGTMSPQGDFKNLINESPRGLSKALDNIPFQGNVEEEHYQAFAEGFRAAFKDKSHKGGVPTASRLLALKRPDVFVAVNKANRYGVCEAFNTAPTTLSLGNYWERIVVPTLLSPWWQEPRPRRRQDARIWDCRAALLDCIYYDPSKQGGD